MFLMGIIGLLILVIFLISAYRSIEQISTTWVETTPVGFEVDKVQNRIRSKSTEYFFKIHFYYHANGLEYSIITDTGYRSIEEAKKQAAKYIMPEDFKIWYDKSDPENFEVYKPLTLGHPFLLRSVISFLLLLLIAWILVKLNKTRTEPNIN